MGDLIEPPPPTEFTQASVPRETEDDTKDPDDLRNGTSAKIDQLIHLLKLTPSTDKSLVFSQFTSFLDKVCRSNLLCGYSVYTLGRRRSRRRWKLKGQCYLSRLTNILTEYVSKNIFRTIRRENVSETS